MEQPEMDSEVVAEDIASDDLVEDESLLDSEVVEEEAEEEDEIEVDGRKFSLPKSAAEKLKAERLMQADYTRKTQEVAEQRKQIEQQAQQVQQQAKFQQEYINDVAKIAAIDDQLKQYEGVNLQEMIDSDPIQAMKVQEYLRTLQQQRQLAVGTLTQKQQQQQWEQQQAIAKQIQEGQAVLARDINGWSPELASKLVEYGVSTGIPREVMGTITDPSQVKIIHKAYLYDQLVKEKTSKPKESQSAPPPTRISAKATGAAKDPEKMSTDEWLRWRESQIKRNR